MRKHAPVALAVVLGLCAGGACKKDEAAAPAPATVAAPAAPPTAAPPPAPAAPAAGLARIVVTNQGTITVNGKPSTLDQVKTLLASATDRPTSIEYSREDRDHDPTPEAAPVVHGLLSAIMDSKIPVKMAR